MVMKNTASHGHDRQNSTSAGELLDDRWNSEYLNVNDLTSLFHGKIKQVPCLEQHRSSPSRFGGAESTVC